MVLILPELRTTPSRRSPPAQSALTGLILLLIADDWDRFGYLLNGSFTQLARNDSQGSGSSQFSVLDGDTFGFRVFTVDNIVGPGVATISNFSAPVPVPLETDALPVVGAAAFMAGGIWWKKKRAGAKVSDFVANK